MTKSIKVGAYVGSRCGEGVIEVEFFLGRKKILLGMNFFGNFSIKIEIIMFSLGPHFDL